MTRLVLIDDRTGLVVGEWRGSEIETPPPAVAGRTWQPADKTTDYTHTRWDGTAFVAVMRPETRQVSRLDFARRFTLEEDAAIDTLADTDRTVRTFMRRLSLASVVHLDHPDVVAGLAYLKAVGIPAVWPDEATADRRIAEIRASADRA